MTEDEFREKFKKALRDWEVQAAARRRARRGGRGRWVADRFRKPSVSTDRPVRP